MTEREQKTAEAVDTALATHDKTSRTARRAVKGGFAAVALGVLAAVGVMAGNFHSQSEEAHTQLQTDNNKIGQLQTTIAELKGTQETLLSELNQLENQVISLGAKPVVGTPFLLPSSSSTTPNAGLRASPTTTTPRASQSPTTTSPLPTTTTTVKKSSGGSSSNPRPASVTLPSLPNLPISLP